MTAPAATGQRRAWGELPERVRAATEAWLGSPVASATTQPTGFSPGVAARLACADGRRYFVKAVSAEPNPTSPAYHRREARIVGALPATTPVPRLLWTYDDGDWVLLVFEDVAGTHPAEPWRDDELARVLAAMAEVAALLTPSPIRTRTAGDLLARDICSWRRLLAAPPEALDPWSRRHLPRLAELDARAPAAIAGDTLVHFDIRGDNVLLAADRVVVLDWPHASIGAAWADLVCFAPSVAMQGGPAPAELARRYPPIAAAAVADVDAVLAAVAGFFTARALEPPPPGLPTLRPFQAAQAEVARAWLAERLHLG